MVPPQDTRERHINQVTLVECLDSVLFPIDLSALFARLPEIGWLVPSPIEEEGARRIKEAPTKANVRLRLDVANMTIGVTSNNDLPGALEAFTEIRNLAREVSDFGTSVSTRYVEFRYIGWIKASSQPLQVFASWWSGTERLTRLGQALNDRMPSDATHLSPYGIRFAPALQDANRPNWAELSITPVNTASQSRYHFDMLFRNMDSDTTQRVAQSADDIVDTTLAELERHQ